MSKVRVILRFLKVIAGLLFVTPLILLSLLVETLKEKTPELTTDDQSRVHSDEAD